jgi:hypothetical protein
MTVTDMISIYLLNLVFFLVSTAAKYTFSPQSRSDLADIQQICPKWQVDISSAVEGHAPWTHEPYCLLSNLTGKEVCVFTNANYHFGQGISIIATPGTAKNIVRLGLVSESQFESEYLNTPNKYEEIERPGYGVGLFVKESQEIKAGELIFVDHPTLLSPNDSKDPLRTEDDLYLLWKAVLQLPGEAKLRTLKLAKSKKNYMDDIKNIISTNAFTHEKADVAQDVLFTEASVSPSLILIIWHELGPKVTD